jgi:hypothetical protein
MDAECLNLKAEMMNSGMGFRRAGKIAVIRRYCLYRRPSKVTIHFIVCLSAPACAERAPEISFDSRKD